MRGLVACAGLMLALGAIGVADAATTPNLQLGPLTILSNERTRSTWAYVNVATDARARPDPGARKVARLRTLTPDWTREVVLVLAQQQATDGKLWVQVRLPMRPNNTLGWIHRRSLGSLRVNEDFLSINRRTLRAKLFVRGVPVWRAAIGVGTAQFPTPAGRFYLRERLAVLDEKGPYGPFALGTSGYSDQLTDWPGGGMVGIHGTNQPGLIPGRVSHGCVRTKNSAIRRLWKLMPLGTPIKIR